MEGGAETVVDSMLVAVVVGEVDGVGLVRVHVWPKFRLLAVFV